MARYLVVLSEVDPVALGVGERWGVGSAAGPRVGPTPIRELTPDVWVLRRAERHIHDSELARALVTAGVPPDLPVVFPSVHFSESGPTTFTAHPLGNFGPAAEVGGQPRQLTPSAPRLMTDAIRRLTERTPEVGIGVTYEATHHGPLLDRPAFFVEVGGTDPDHPRPEQLHALAQVIPNLTEDTKDRVAVGVGGGHYVPHLTQLAQRRHWAFGHMIPRHALESPGGVDVHAVVAATPGCEGIVYTRAADAATESFRSVGPRLRDQDAPLRESPGPA